MIVPAPVPIPPASQSPHGSPRSLPTGHGDNVIGVGADALLVRPKDQMCALIKGIPQDMTDPCPPQE